MSNPKPLWLTILCVFFIIVSIATVIGCVVAIFKGVSEGNSLATVVYAVIGILAFIACWFLMKEIDENPRNGPK